MAQSKPIAPLAPHVRPKRIAFHVNPQHCENVEPMVVPWMTIIVLLLIVMVVFALWGKLPRRSRPSHEVPGGNAPGASLLDSPARLPPLFANMTSC